MPKLDQHHSSKLVKVLYIGDSGTGKTGSLASLVGAGYNLKIIDLDNGLDALVQFVRKDHLDRQGNVEFETVRDIYEVGAAGPRIKTARAFVECSKLLTRWTDNSIPSEWGPKTICVIDSLTTLGKAAYEWSKGQNPGAKDPRQWYFTAQQALENIIAMTTSEAFSTNLIIISHINFRELPSGEIKGYASTIGSALGPTVPKYFNSMILAETAGFGKNMMRRIRTVSTGIVDLKNPAPFKLDKELPLETGLATLFETLTTKDN
jgi:hypothetical protein